MKLVIFDLDNTLVHSQIDYAGMRYSVADLLRASGVTQDSDVQMRRYSVGELLAQAAAQDDAIAEIAWGRVLDFERAGMVKASVEADAAQTLQVLLDDGFKLAVLTNNARPATMAALEKFELLSYFDLILTRNEVTLKPDPAGILTAKSTLGAGHVFHVGDAWLDGAAANRAGVPYIAFRPLPEAFKGRDIKVWNTVQQLSELPRLVAISE